MTTTDNLELELVSGTETFDTDKVMNNFTKIDTAVGNLQDGVGNVESLKTTAKTDLVAAINEVDGNIGDLSGLSTTAKENLVSAVNELNQNRAYAMTVGGNTNETKARINCTSQYQVLLAVGIDGSYLSMVSPKSGAAIAVNFGTDQFTVNSIDQTTFELNFPQYMRVLLLSSLSFSAYIV